MVLGENLYRIQTQNKKRATLENTEWMDGLMNALPLVLLDLWGGEERRGEGGGGEGGVEERVDAVATLQAPA